MDKYYKNNREKILQKKKEYYLRNRLEKISKRREYYTNNKEKVLDGIRAYQKKNSKVLNKKKLDYKKRTGYFTEKNPYQKFMREVRKQTRKKFPYIGKKCDYCGELAKGHHHFTIPARIEMFTYVCNKCHKEIHQNKF